MPPHTRMTSVKENRMLRSKSVRLVEGIRISLTRCDNTNGLPRSNKSSKKTISNRGGKTSISRNTISPKPKDKPKRLSLTKKKSSKSEEKSLENKSIAVQNHTRISRSKASLPITPKKDKQSPKKAAATEENVERKQSPIKTTTTNKDASKSENRIKKPNKKDLSNEFRVRKQMKLGRIFIKPTFPIKSIIKRRIHSGDVEENQGQFVSTTDSSTTTRTRELNNNIVKQRRVQPKIVLCKIDQQHGKRKTRSWNSQNSAKPLKV